MNLASILCRSHHKAQPIAAGPAHENFGMYDVVLRSEDQL